MTNAFRFITGLLFCTVLLGSFSFLTTALAQPTPTINYQGKLTTPTGLAVTDGPYTMEFRLYTSPTGGSAIWTETLTGANEVTVTNGLFSVMLGSTTPLTSVDFNQPLYLGINIESDGEMTPRKPFGTVPAAFEAQRVGGVASTSFLRSDQADTASGLLTFTGGLISTASTSITNLTTLTATTTNLVINGERFTDLTGTGLINTNGVLTVATSSLGLGDFRSDGTIAMTDTLQLAQGALGTGGLSFAGDPDTGIKREFADQITFQVGGMEPIYATPLEVGFFGGGIVIDSVRQAFVSDRFRSNNLSTASNVLFGVGNDVGLFFPSTGVLGLSTAGTERLRIGSNGFVGIGTTTPSQMLTVAGGVRITGALVDNASSTGSNGMVLQSTGSGFNWVATSTLGISGGASLFTDGGTNTYLTSLTDNLSIGGTGGTSRLNVFGDIDISNGSGGISFTGTRFFYASTTNDSIAIGENVSGAGVGSLQNVAIGSGAMFFNTSGDYNVAIGNDALSQNNNSSSYNAAIGNLAQANGGGQYNVSLGYRAGRGDNGGFTSLGGVYIGADTGLNLTGLNTDNNVFIGYQAGTAVTTGENNILLGASTASNLTTGSNNIFIGHNVDATAVGVSNQLNIGNLIFGTGVDGTGTTLSSGNVGIGTSTPSQRLTVAGGVRITGALVDNASSTGSNGMVLQSTGSGFNWVATSTLGISGGASLFTDGGANTYLTSLTDNLSIGGTGGTSRLNVFADVSGFGASIINDGNVANRGGLLIQGGLDDSSAAGPSTLLQFNDGDGTYLGDVSFSSGILDVEAQDQMSFTSGGIEILTLNGFFTEATFNADVFATSLETSLVTTNSLVSNQAAIGYSAQFTNDGNNTNRSGILIQAGLDNPATVGPSTLIQFNDGDGGSVGTMGFGGNSLQLNAATGQNLALQNIGTGRVGIGTTTPSQLLTVAGGVRITGALVDNASSTGSNGMVLQSTGSGFEWVATSSLGITGGGGGSTDFATFDGSNVTFTNTAVETNLATSTVPANTLTQNGQMLEFVAYGNVLNNSGATRVITPRIKVNGTTVIADSTGNLATSATARTVALVGKVIRTGVATANIAIEVWVSNTGTATTGQGDIGVTSTFVGVLHSASDITWDWTASNNLTVSMQMTTAAANFTYNHDYLAVTKGGSGGSGPAGLAVADIDTSLELIGLVSDETGTGSLMFANSPTITTPFISTINGGSANNSTLTLRSTTGVGTTDAIIFGVGNNGATEAMRILNNANVGLGTTTPYARLSVAGNVAITGGLFDNNATRGVSGMVLQSTGTGLQWVATSTLGIPASLFTDGGANTFLSSLTDNLSIGGTGGSARLNVFGDIDIASPSAGISFMGSRFLYGSTTNGSFALGEESGLGFRNNTIDNIALGYRAAFVGQGNNSDYNTFIGYQAGYNASTTGGSNNIIGYEAGFESQGSDSNLLGRFAGYYQRGAHANLIGTEAGAYNRSGYITAIGYRAGYNASTTGADYNNFIGAQAGYNSRGFNNDIFGFNAGYNNNGFANLILGQNTGYNNTGDNAVLIGGSAGYANSGNYNVFIGDSAGYNSNNDYNIAIGWESSRFLQGYDNVTVGSGAMRGTGIYAGLRNVAIGTNAGYNAAGADDNILIGNSAGSNLTTGDRNIIIGYDVSVPVATGGNQLNIGNLIFGTNIDGTGTTFSSGNIGIGTSSPSQRLTVAGGVRITGALVDNINSAGTNGMVLQSTGSGFAWVATSTLGLGGGSSFTTSAGLAAVLSDETGTGNVVFSDSPTLTGTFSAALANFSGRISQTGTNANIALGLNYLSGDGNDEGIFVDSVGNVNIGTATTTPLGKFVVYGSAGSMPAIARFYTDGGSNNLAINGDADRMYLSAHSGLVEISGMEFSSQYAANNNYPALVSGLSGDLLLGYDDDEAIYRFAGSGLVVSTSGNVGVGTTSPSARLSVQRTGYGTAGTGLLDQWLQTTNNTNGAVLFGNSFFVDADNTATTTLVGTMLRIDDSTVFGNTVRGLEVQSNRGTNTNGENTAISGTGRTFGVRGITEGDAGASFEPAGGFFQTRGVTQGNAIRGYTSSLVSGALMSLFQDTSNFAGTGLQMNFGNTTGDFSDNNAKFIDLQNAGVSVFRIGAFGSTTIGDGTTSNIASLQIGFGGLCVDNDGSCHASTTGRISSVSSYTGNSDLAEMYFSDQSLQTGEVVMLEGGLSVARADRAGDLPILGVVSTKPGLLLGFDDTSLQPGEQGYPIALSGRVPIRLSTENGPIKKGDPLTLSSIAGVAMKATSSGVIIGRALEDFDESRMYSDTFVNQFGDDMADPVYQPVVTNDDPRINDGCYYSGGTDSGAPCIPLSGATAAEQVAAANQIIENENKQTMSTRLRNAASETRMLEDGRSVKVGQVVMFVNLSYRWFDDTQAAAFDILTSTSSVIEVGDNENETLFDRLVTLANNFVDGVLSIFELRADRVNITEELCVDGVCIDANDLREILEKNNVSPESSYPAEPEPTGGESPAEGSGGEPESSEPEPEPQPEPEPEPEVSNEPEPESQPDPQPEPSQE